MAHYMIQATYNAEARKAFIANPQDRAAAVGALMQQMGGRVESFYFAMGEFDVVVIAEIPDDVSAVAGALAATGAGHLGAYHTTKLLTNDEMMSAMHKAHGVSFPAPSGD